MDVRAYCRPYYTEVERGQVEVYISSLNVFQTQTLEIAREHLKTSFDILKSGGYVVFHLRWKRIIQKWGMWAILQLWRRNRKKWHSYMQKRITEIKHKANL